MRPLVLLLTLAVAGGWGNVGAAQADGPSSPTNAQVLAIDLPSTLRLVRARSLDVDLAQAKLAEARANQASAAALFLPVVVPGVGYRRHDDLLQDVAGHVIEVHKDSYTAGPTLALQLDLGDALYQRLAARQLVSAAEFGVERQRRDSALAAVREYFELARSRAAIRVAAEAVRLAEELAGQLTQAVGAGIAFKGDALRAEVQADRNRLTWRQAKEQSAVAVARLRQTLHLDGQVELTTRDEDFVPLVLVETNAALAVLVSRALTTRPEMHESHAQLAAAVSRHDAVRYGPLIPSLGAQVFAGGLGGGGSGIPGRFGESEDYQVSLGWRIGPGGLFDRGRVRASAARRQIAQLADQKLRDEITREVVESQARLQSWSDQLGIAGHAVQRAEEALQLAAQRKEYAVGVALERVLAEQDLTRARLDYVNAVAEFNRAHYAALHALGGVW